MTNIDTWKPVSDTVPGLDEKKPRCFIIGTGPCPKRYTAFERINRLKIDKLIGIKGAIWLHLHGAWWELLPPEALYKLLNQWVANDPLPYITVSL